MALHSCGGVHAGSLGGCKKTMILLDGGEVRASHAAFLHPGAEMLVVTGIRNSCNGVSLTREGWGTAHQGWEKLAGPSRTDRGGYSSLQGLVYGVTGCRGNHFLADEGRMGHGASGVGSGPLQARTEGGGSSSLQGLVFAVTVCRSGHASYIIVSLWG